MKKAIRDAIRVPYRVLQASLFEGIQWKSRRYAAPSPRYVKNHVLLRNSERNAIWVETGTFLGETTKLLAADAIHLYSLEPAVKLYERAVKKFATCAHVEIINGPSETVFPVLIPKLKGAVNFWLDGHYSAGNTFLGEKETPVVEELRQIALNLDNFSAISVMIDDVRCFSPTREDRDGYPSLDFLVDWARLYGFCWHIEHDIFVAKRGSESEQ